MNSRTRVRCFEKKTSRVEVTRIKRCHDIKHKIHWTFKLSHSVSACESGELHSNVCVCLNLLVKVVV